MTTQTDFETKERDFLASCVADAYTMLDLIPGVDPNGPPLVWLAEQFLELRRRSETSAHTPIP